MYYKKLINIAVVIGGTELPAWIHNIISRLKETKYINLSIIKNPKHNEVKYSPVYNLFNKLDNRFLNRIPDALSVKDSNELLMGLPLLKADNHSDLSTLDFLINLSGHILSPQLESSAKFGVWEYQISDSTWNNTDHHQSLLLLRDNHDGQHRIVDNSSPNANKLSPSRNASLQYWYATDLIHRQLSMFKAQGEKQFMEHCRSKLTINANEIRHNCHLPSNLQVGRKAVKLSSRLTTRLLQRMFYRDQWYLMFDFENRAQGEISKFQILEPANDRFWADPFVIYKNDRYYIFFEELIYKNGKGHIVVIEMDNEGNYSQPEIVLERDYHLSYPFIFEWDETFYLIPETGGNRTIELYECVSFPTRWTFKMYLMKDVLAVDTTLFEQDGKWWLFCALEQDYRGLDGDALYLFSADQPITDQWKAHPMNPVVSDSTHSRPAGRLFLERGKLYRPSQNCRKLYGHALSISEVTALSESDYTEELIKTIWPDWNQSTKGIHTISQTHDLTVVDAFRYKWRW